MMRSLRYIWRFTTAFVTKFRFLLIIGGLTGIFGFGLITRLFPLLLPGNVERVGLTARVNPDNLPSEITHLISHGLTHLNETGVPQPEIAASWNVSEDGKIWTFHLKKDLRWQDGKKLVAADINYPFSDVAVERPDESTIVFKLQNPFSPFASVVARPVFKKGLLGIGGWRVVPRGLRLAGPYVESVSLVDAAKNRKIFKFYPTEERTKLAFKLGAVDRIENVLTAKPFESWGNVKIGQNTNAHQLVAVFLNTQDKELSEKSLRQALAYGIDKENLAAPRAISPISPDSWAFNSQVKPYNFDQRRAKELIESLPKEQREVLGIKLVTTAVLLDVAEKVATDWNNIGVRTEVQVTTGIPEDFQALLAIFDIPADPDQYSSWHSTQTNTNITNLSNPRIDKLLEDGRTVTKQAERKNIYLDFQRFLVEESPAIFLYHPITYTISRK